MNRSAWTGSALGSFFVGSFFLRLFFPFAAVSSTAALQPAPAAHTTRTVDAESDGPWKASQSFFAGWGPKQCPDPKTTDPEIAKWCIHTDTVNGLIAIVPDPVRTHLSLTFDRTLEGLQLAAQIAGYKMDRYWLPWSVQLKTASTDSAEMSDVDREKRAGQPGLVLFRQDSSTTSGPRVLFVFLVADTATTGIDGTQFAKAVSYIDQVCPPKTCNTYGRIRIVGPSFSGSLASLRRLTNESSTPTRPPAHKYITFSGAVSSVCALADQALLETWPPECGTTPTDYEDTQKAEATHLELRTSVHDTESSIELLVHGLYPHLSEPDCTKIRVAVLSEGATTFGGTVARSTSRRDSLSLPSFSRCIDTFTYPREIASLRNAGRAAAGSATTADTSTTLSSPTRQLPLDLTDRTNSNDAPPDFSVIQSPLSKEAVLMNIAAGMRRAHYHYIGIIGTNVLDVLFLTDFLRDASPDSRLFVLSADLMFERELDNAPYVGMVAVTTYPLTDKTWEHEHNNTKSPRLPFADEYEQGQYDATTLALENLRALDDGFHPTPQLPLWMMVVGNGGYWPIGILDGGNLSLKPTLDGSDLAGAWLVLLVVVCGLATLHVGMLLTASPFGHRFRDYALVAAAPRQRLFYIQVASATLAFGLGVLLMPAYFSDAFTWTKVVGIVALVAVVGAAILLEALYISRWKWTLKMFGTSAATTSELQLQLGTFTLVWVLAVALLFAWRSLLGSDVYPKPTTYGFFFAYRAVHLGSGVSPITPLIPLLVTLYAWTCFEIWRLRFSDDLRARLTPDRGPDEKRARPRPGELTETPIARAVNRYFLRPGYLVPFGMVFAIWLTFLHPTNPFQLFERRTFSVLYLVLFSLVVALMLSSGFRMAQIWSELHRLLLELERRPIRSAFGRLKGNWSFWRQGGEDAEWAYLVRSLESLAQLGSGTTPAHSGVPDLKFFRQRIERFTDAADRIAGELTAHKMSVVLADDLVALDDGLTSTHTILRSSGANPFLRSAVDDARAAAHTAAELAKSSDPKPDPTVLRSAIAALPGRLRGARDIIELAELSTRAQAQTGAVSSVWLSLQDNQPLLTALESLSEYRRAADAGQPIATPGAASSSFRVVRFYELERLFCGLQTSLAFVLAKAWDVLEWRHANTASNLSVSEEPSGEKPAKTPARDTSLRQLDVIEEFVALRYVTFIRGVLGHLRHVMIFLALSFSLVLISLNVYSFEPHQSLIWSFTLIFIVNGFLVVGVLVQLHHDPILRSVTGTTGNALDVHFYLRIVGFAAVPLLTLLATHYPSIGRYLVSFLQPGLEALK